MNTCQDLVQSGDRDLAGKFLKKTMTNQNQPNYCNLCSLEVGEEPFGTAPATDVWLLLEFTGNWGSDALPESNLPQSVKDKLSGWLEATPRARFLFIKQRDSKAETHNAFYVALSTESESRLYRFALASYEDLLSLDVPAIIDRNADYDDHISAEPLFAVCTNGRRDLACSKFGTPAYERMNAIAGQQAWESTHMTGHRFSPVVVCLPAGVCYGHLELEELETAINGYKQGHLLTNKLRGRSHYPQPVQAAEFHLRQRLDLHELDALCLAGFEQTDETHWTVRFTEAATNIAHEIHLEKRLSEWETYKNTGDAEKQRFPKFYPVA